MLKTQFLRQINTDITNNIRLADQKAFGLIAINSTIIGVLYNTFDNLATQSLRLPTYLLIALVIILGIAVGIGVWVIFPRGFRNKNNSPDGNMVLLPKIHRQHETPAEYAERMKYLDEPNVIEQYSHLIFSRAQTNDCKYHALRCCIIVSFLGWVGSILFLGWYKVFL